MNLTDDKVAKLKLSPDHPDGKVFFDDKISGFGVRVYRSGRRTWLYQFRLAGRSHKYEIGSVATIPAEKARTEARIADGQVAKGENPIEFRRLVETKNKEMFGELVHEYLDEKLHPIKQGKKPMRPRSYSEVQRHLEEHCKSLKHRPIRSITQADVASLHKKIAREKGNGAASHTWSSLRAMMHWAMQKGAVEQNVAALYDGGGNSDPRDRTLTDSEIATVWKACGADQFGTIVRLLILTGGRRDEVGHMHVSELSLGSTQWQKPTWLLPGERSKNGREHLVPLSDMAAAQLIKAVETRDQFVFGHGKPRGFSGWGKAKTALDKRIEDGGHQIEHWTLHDVRRSFAAGLQRLKIEPHVIEACLNHAPPKLQRVYQTYDYEPEKRAALACWAEHVDAIVNDRTADNVVSLRETRQ
jgi:integrase